MGRRYANRKDANHKEIADALRDIGVGVWDAANFGWPCDLYCVQRGRSEWLEVKDGDKPPSKQRPSEDCIKFAEWLALHGKSLHIVSDVGAALRIFGGRVEIQRA